MSSETDTISARAREVVEEFELFDDWMGRYEHLIELGKALPPLDDAFRTEVFQVRGCQSQVWMAPEKLDSGRLRFHADSDAMITRGLVALLVRVFSDQPAEAILAADLQFLDDIGMKEHLSSTRKNGLDAMVRKMKQYAGGMTA